MRNLFENQFISWKLKKKTLLSSIYKGPKRKVLFILGLRLRADMWLFSSLIEGVKSSQVEKLHLGGPNFVFIFHQHKVAYLISA
jgi:hypothetical protein